MKKIICIISFIMLIFFFVGCEGAGTSHKHQYIDGVCSCGKIEDLTEDSHKHEYVDGICSCGKENPLYKYPHIHNFIDGICSCGKTVEVIGSEHRCQYVDGYCECGDTISNESKHKHQYIDGYCECGISNPDDLSYHEHHFYQGVCSCLEEEQIEFDHEHVYEDKICVYCGRLSTTYPQYIGKTYDIEYTLSDDGTYYIATGIEWHTDYYYKKEIVEIPSKYYGLPVKEIREMGWGVKKLIIPESIEYIDPVSINDVSGWIIVDENNPNYQSVDGVLYSKDLKTLIYYPYNKGNEPFVVPENVEVLGERSFFKYHLSEIILHDNIQEILENAFSASKLEKINLPSSLETINKGIFHSCYYLTEVNVAKNVSIINMPIGDRDCIKMELKIDKNNPNFKLIDGSVYTYDGKKLIHYNYNNTQEKFIIPDGVVEIGPYAFYEHRYLQKINFPKSLRKINEYAFEYVQLLDEVNFNEGLEEIGVGAFTGSSNILKLILPSSLQKIEKAAFMYCRGLEKIEIPDNIKILDEHVLLGCYKLTTIKLPKNLEEIKYRALSGCKSLENLLLPNTLKIIGDEAFRGCEKLIEIEIPSSVTSIGNYVFDYCLSLKEVTLPKALDEIGEYTFAGCSNVQFKIEEGNLNFIIEDGVLYDSKKTVILKYNINKKEKLYVVPETVKKIAPYAFENASNLEKIYLPDSLKEIGSGAFYGCTNLYLINIPKNVTSIGEYAFNSCDKLLCLIIPKSVEKLNVDSFVKTVFYCEAKSKPSGWVIDTTSYHHFIWGYTE